MKTLTYTKLAPIPEDGTAEQTKERMQHSGRLRRPRNRGHAVIEVAFLCPWILFLFMGTFDMGFYSHALIATENAARAGAEYTSGNRLTAANQAGACRYALEELKAMSNVRGLTTCDSSPLIVTASPVTIDGWNASSVSVTYRTDKLIPIPGLLGQQNITRTVTMLVK